MDWFRHYHGLCTDPKLHKVARKAKVSRGLVIAAWCAILETASQSDPRGCAEDIDETSLAFMIDVQPHIAERIIQCLKNANMIDDSNYVVSWKKRQKESDDVKKRVERHRAKKSKPLKNNETNGSGNVTVTPLEQNRTEQKESTSLRSVESSAPADQKPPAPAKLKTVNGKRQYPEPFERAWQAYPTRPQDGKADCYAHWRKAVLDKVPPDDIEQGALAWQATAGDKYRPGMRSWLRNRRWTEPPPQAETGYGDCPELDGFTGWNFDDDEPREAGHALLH